MLGKSTSKKLSSKQAVVAAPQGSSVNFKSKTYEVTSSTGDAEKPHKGSLKKAKRKALKLKDGLPTEQELIDEIPSNVSSQEREHLGEYLHMFRKLKKLIRKAERTCLTDGSNSREYYALCALYSQQREIIADIRSVSDMSGQVLTMETNVVRPLVSSVGQNILDTMFQIRKLIIECADKGKTQAALLKLEEVTHEQGKFLQQQYVLANEKVSGILLG